LCASEHDTAEHGKDLGHQVLLNICVMTKFKYRACLIRGARELKLHPNMKRDERFHLSRSWKHLMYSK
jgi:hypothetical protein